MKSIIIIIFLSFACFSQNTIRVIYQQDNFYADSFFQSLPVDQNERDEIKKDMTKPSYLELVNNGEFSLLRTIDKPQQNNLGKKATYLDNNISGGLKLLNEWIFKNFTEKYNLSLREIITDKYIIKQPFEKDSKYTFSNKIKKIDKYNCKLAYVLSKRNTNDTIKFWYTDEIPIIDGPFDSSIIPGLILSYETKVRNIYAIQIEFIEEKIEIKNKYIDIPILSEARFQEISSESEKPKEYIDEKGRNAKTSEKIFKPE